MKTLNLKKSNNNIFLICVYNGCGRKIYPDTVVLTRRKYSATEVLFSWALIRDVDLGQVQSVDGYTESSYIENGEKFAVTVTLNEKDLVLFRV